MRVLEEEEHMEVLWMGLDRGSVQQIRELWRQIVLWAAEIGIGRRILWVDLRADGVMR